MTKEKFKARITEFLYIDDSWEDFLEKMWKLHCESKSSDDNCDKLQEELNEIKKRISKLERDKQILVPFVQTTDFPYDDFPCDGIHCTNPYTDCTNCPLKVGYGWNTIATTDISKIKADENPHWVNAKEVVPEISALGVSDKVICYDGDNMYMACYNHKTQKWETPHQGEILYWMNLPKPPKV